MKEQTWGVLYRRTDGRAEVEEVTANSVQYGSDWLTFYNGSPASRDHVIVHAFPTRNVIEVWTKGD